LEEVARKVLGLPPEEKPSLEGLPKGPIDLPSIVKEQGSTEEAAPADPGPDPAGRTEEPLPPGPNGGGSREAEDLARKLREYEQRFQKKAHEVEKLKVKLQKAEKARLEAESAKGKALEEAAHLRKALAERERLLSERVGLEEKVAELLSAKAALEKRLKEQEEELRRLKESLPAREALSEENARLRERLSRMEGFREALPEPFPQEALLRVLVLDYPRLAREPRERLLALLEGYQAFLQGKDHPALAHSNRDFLEKEAEGVVLLGLERLLLDLASLPLARWLRAHAFRLEAWLFPEEPSSPRLSED
jgi:DNA repair exonuclease SbcCD ATPase subunit